jgi:hypothetical protein
MTQTMDKEFFVDMCVADFFRKPYHNNHSKIIKLYFFANFNDLRSCAVQKCINMNRGFNKNEQDQCIFTRSQNPLITY